MYLDVLPQGGDDVAQHLHAEVGAEDLRDVFALDLDQIFEFLLQSIAVAAPVTLKLVHCGCTRQRNTISMGATDRDDWL